jgi:hypothetical protein
MTELKLSLKAEVLKNIDHVLFSRTSSFFVLIRRGPNKGILRTNSGFDGLD